MSDDAAHEMPEELVQEIVKLVSDTPTLRSLCLVCRRFYRVCLPFLYRRFSYRMFTDPSRLHGFVRAIVAKPDLALQTRSVEQRNPRRSEAFWDLKSWKEWSEKNYKPLLEVADRYLFLGVAKALHEERPEKRLEIVENEEAQFALLLALTPNLTELHIENPASARDQPRFTEAHLFMKMVQPLIKSGSILRNLRTLVASTSKLEGGQGGFRLAAIAPFFRIPTLKTVRCIVCEEPEDAAFEGFDCPKGASNVSELTFHSSALCPIALEHVLDACRALEVFECDWAGTVVGYVEVNFSALRKALLGHTSHLRKIYLDTQKHFDSWPEHEDGLVPPLGAMHAFEALKELDVPGSALIGWDEEGFGNYKPLHDVLPPEIECLRINVAAPRVYEQVAELAKFCDDKYPRLRKIVIVDDVDQKLLTDLREKYEDWGSEVKIDMEQRKEADHFN